jgi:hypothetical protein
VTGLRGYALEAALAAVDDVCWSDVVKITDAVLAAVLSQTVGESESGTSASPYPWLRPTASDGMTVRSLASMQDPPT